MSLNYQELAKTTQALQCFFPAPLKRIGLLEFSGRALPAPVRDLSIGFELGGGEILALSLRTPWVGLFFYSLDVLRGPARGMKWNATTQIGNAFGGLSPFFEKEILRVESLALWPGDRVVQLSLRYRNSKTQLEFTGTFLVQLFPARPNWEFLPAAQDQQASKVSWRGEILKKDDAVTSLPVGGAIRNLWSSLDGLNFLAESSRNYLALRQVESRKLFLERILVWSRARQAHFRKIHNELESSKRESLKSEQLRLFGETLKSVLHEYPKNWKGDLISVGELDIPIQEGLTLPEQSAAFFQAARKFERTGLEVQARERMISATLAKFSAVSGHLLSLSKQIPALDFELVLRIREIFREQELPEGVSFIDELSGGEKASPVQSKRVKLYEKAGLKSYGTREGHTIWVGRNARENEELVMRLAKGNDLWMHLKGKPGAHVVIQSLKNKSISLETLLDAALLCAFYSDVKVGNRVEVDYTFRKNVKRVSGGGSKGKGKKPSQSSGKQFLVTYFQNKTLMVDVSQEKLQSALSR